MKPLANRGQFGSDLTITRNGPQSSKSISWAKSSYFGFLGILAISAMTRPPGGPTLVLA